MFPSRYFPPRYFPGRYFPGEFQESEPTTTLHLTIAASRTSNRLFATRSQLAVIAHRESNEVDV